MDDKNPASYRHEFGVQPTRIEALEFVEISGQIKWFDGGKGYGFIVPDTGGPDVLLHVTTLRKDGFQTAHEGTHIVCEAVRRAKGLQVLKIISMDPSAATHPGETTAHAGEWRAPRTHAQVASAGGFEIVVVKWFNRARGFGFLTRGDGTQDIFIHMETLRHYGVAELRPGDSLLARFGDGPKGLMAAEVRLLNAAVPISH